MSFWGLTTADIAVIAGYFIVVIIIGYRAAKRIKNQEDYFLGGRKFGKTMMCFATFAHATSADTAVGTTTMVHTNGSAGLLANMAYGLIITPIFWFIVPWYRRIRTLTLADFFKQRYNSTIIASFYALLQAILFMLYAALGLIAMSKTVTAIMAKPIEKYSVVERAEYQSALEIEKLEDADFATLNASQQARLKELRLQNPKKEVSYINENMMVAIAAVIILIYAVTGGLEAAFMTDIIQGIFTVFLAIILVPFAMVRINQVHGTSGFLGPFRAMHQNLPESFFELWGSPKIIEFTWFWIASFAVLVLIGTGPEANNLTAFGAAKNELSARIGALIGSLTKRYCIVIWGMVAMFALVLYSGVVKNPDYVWGYASRDLLGPFKIGLVGLMIACLMSALMSTVDMLMIAGSSLMTHNIYKIFVPNRSEKHYLCVGRICSGLFVVGAVLTATRFTTIFALIKFSYSFNCIVAASFWLGMLWQRANKTAVWSSMGFTFCYLIVLPMLIPMMPGVRTNPYLLKTTDPAPIVRSYTASEADVTERLKEIDTWDKLSTAGLAKDLRPEPLNAGEKFQKTYVLPQKSVFWQQGLEVKDDQTCGSGLLRIEMVLIDKLGFDLSENSYALNETIVILLRIIIPFVVLVVVALLTKPDDSDRLRRFYSKMRTPVLADREADEKQLRNAYDNFAATEKVKLFPHSNWEFKKWTRIDLVGFLCAVTACSGVVLLLYLLVTLGK